MWREQQSQGDGTGNEGGNGHKRRDARHPDGRREGANAETQPVAFPCSLCEKPVATVRLGANGEVVVDGLVCRITARIAPENEPRLRTSLTARDGVSHLIEQCCVVVPGDLCRSLLHN